MDIAHRRRPPVVTVAVTLMVAVAAGWLVDAIALVAGAGAYPDRVAEDIADSGFEGPAGMLGGFARALSIVAIVLTVAAAVGMVVVALLSARGSFGGRIAAWVIIGLTMCCDMTGLGSALSGFSGNAYVSAYSTDTSGTRHNFGQRLPDGYPDWYQPLSGSIAIFAVLALGTATVLLALPRSNDFFRRQPVVPAVPSWYAQGPRPQWTADQAAALSVLAGQRQRGEISDEQYLAEYRRVLRGR